MIVFLVINIFNVAYASPDIYATVSTDKQIYGSNELVHVYGDLKRDGAPVTNALIAVQVNDAQNNVVSIRTCSTGTTPSPWAIDITSLFSCDQMGNPKNTFMKGSLAYFEITVRSLDTISARYATVTINLHDSDQVSFGIAWVGTTVGPEREFTYLCSIPIPSDVSTGTAYAFVNVYNKWPKDNGIAYCGEEAVSFTVTDGAGSSGSDGSTSQSSGSEGTYESSFRLRSEPALGDHTVYACYYEAFATTVFDVVWLFTDVNRNGKVDIGDLFIIAKAFGSQPDDPKWNPKADLNGDDSINIVDLYRVAKDFGKTRI